MKTIKTISTLAALVLGLGFMMGCGREGGGQGATAQQPGQAGQGQASAGNAVRIEITGNDQMRFAPTQFEVRRGQQVTLVFRNVGTMPKNVMGHNVVILRQGVDRMEFANAGVRHPNNDYIDPERQNQVIAYTPIIGPGESSEVTFTAPNEAGSYDYVCTFPGHAAAGMVGVMVVN